MPTDDEVAVARRMREAGSPSTTSASARRWSDHAYWLLADEPNGGSVVSDSWLVVQEVLLRLQSYEGIDTNPALYEWGYAR